MLIRALAFGLGTILFFFSMAELASHAQDTTPLRTGQGAMDDWSHDAPGVRRRITIADLPAPYTTRSVDNGPNIIDPPPGATLKVPPNFRVEQFASGLDNPREVRVAPNGDIFVAESAPGRITVMRAADGASHPDFTETFAAGLKLPFGIAFWPPGPNPRFVYVANTDSVVRFPYKSGDLKALGPAQTIVNSIPGGAILRGGGHWTRDVVFSADGAHMFVSVGSATNDAAGLRQSLKAALEYARINVLSSLIDPEARRADVLEFDPDGGEFRIYAAGIRNCVGMAINPVTGQLWCSANERDGLGDDLPPDYITGVRDGGFYGWPWYYIGGHEDPHHRGQRPDLKDKVIVPDVLIQAHSASLEMVFYEGQQFPAEYRGDAFAAEHGSWNRSNQTGYKVIRVRMLEGRATGEYDDFLTGFITEAGVWGRPVGVAVARDGSLMVTEDAHGTIWRVWYSKSR
jgi:glucose/arabinose dehydrogenase